MSVDKTLDQAIEHHVNGQLDQALTLYLQALQLNPRTPVAADLISAILRTHFELALTLMKVGRNKDAILSFQRVLAIQPDESVVHAYLSRLFISGDDLHQATLHLRHYLRLVPEDHIGARMLLAYTGAEAIPERPAQSYIERFYDNYANSYDQKLVNGLQYQAPQIILAALQQHCQDKIDPDTVDILDLGCGTGLCGQALRPMAKRLDGVDLSPQMLAKAQQRNIYDELEVADIYPFMEKKSGCYDVIVAAGLFEHIGDPRHVLTAAFRALKDRGVFIFTAEDNPTQELGVNSSAYYTHGRTYLAERATQSGFSVNALEPTVLWIENGTPVQGLCVVLSKP
jgi:predicted TPR repeat methyltransferase